MQLVPQKTKPHTAMSTDKEKHYGSWKAKMTKQIAQKLSP